MYYNFEEKKKVIPVVVSMVFVIIFAVFIVSDAVLLKEMVDTHIMYNADKIKNLVNDLSVKMEENRQLAVKVYNDPDTNGGRKSFTNETYKIAERMGFYKNTNIYIESIYLYNELEDRVYVSGSVISKKPENYDKDPELKSYIDMPEVKNNSAIKIILRKKGGRNIYSFIVHPHRNSRDCVIINYYANYIKIENGRRIGEE